MPPKSLRSYFFHIVIIIVVTNLGVFLLCVAVECSIVVCLHEFRLNIILSNTKLLVFFVQ
jgi:hypothetical protein